MFAKQYTSPIHAHALLEFSKQYTSATHAHALRELNKWH